MGGCGGEEGGGEGGGEEEAGGGHGMGDGVADGEWVSRAVWSGENFPVTCYFLLDWEGEL